MRGVDTIRLLNNKGQRHVDNLSNAQSDSAKHTTLVAWHVRTWEDCSPVKPGVQTQARVSIVTLDTGGSRDPNGQFQVKQCQSVQ